MSTTDAIYCRDRCDGPARRRRRLQPDPRDDLVADCDTRRSARTEDPALTLFTEGGTAFGGAACADLTAVTEGIGAAVCPGIVTGFAVGGAAAGDWINDRIEDSFG